MGLIANILGLLSTLFVVAIGLIVAFLMVVFVCDVIQTKDAIRRNFPVIGHLRNLFTELGKFFRGISSPWTGRSCHSTGSFATGSIEPPPATTTRSCLKVKPRR